MAAHNLAWFRSPVASEIIPDWAETVCSIEFIALGLVSESFLIDPPECLTLVIHGLLWDFPNIQATQGGSYMVFMSFLVIIPLLGSLRGYLREKWLIMWCQTRRSLSSCPRRSSVDHSLAISYIVSSAPSHICPPPPGWYRFDMGSRLELGRLILPTGSFLGPKSGFYRFLFREPPWCTPLEWRIWVDLNLSSI